MVRFPNAKINIGLNVIARRRDGYHNLETIFYPVEWSDILEVIPSQNLAKLSTSGLNISGKEHSNLCFKAWTILHEKYKIPPVNIHLHKIIPMGAGLGGGSSDGAFVLQMLNETFNLNLTQRELLDFALELGSDCPFFIHNRPVFAAGKGEEIKPVDLDLEGYHICILKPSVHVTTQDAFAMIKPSKPDNSLSLLINMPPEKWRDQIVNDFEQTVFDKFPEIKLLKDKLYQTGAIYASMTGSGSAVYGIFNHKPGMENPGKDVISWIGVLR